MLRIFFVAAMLVSDCFFLQHSDSLYMMKTVVAAELITSMLL